MSEYDRDGSLNGREDPGITMRRLKTGAIYAAFTELADAEKSSIRKVLEEATVVRLER